MATFTRRGETKGVARAIFVKSTDRADTSERARAARRVSPRRTSLQFPVSVHKSPRRGVRVHRGDRALFIYLLEQTGNRPWKHTFPRFRSPRYVSAFRNAATWPRQPRIRVSLFLAAFPYGRDAESTGDVERDASRVVTLLMGPGKPRGTRCRERNKRGGINGAE